MWKQLTAFSALALIVFPAAMQETKKTAEDKPAAQFKVPPEDAKKENPVKPTAESIARGKRTPAREDGGAGCDRPDTRCRKWRGQGAAQARAQAPQGRSIAPRRSNRAADWRA